MLLAIDTSTQWIGLALLHDDLILAEMVWQTRSHHSVELTPGIEQLLQRCGVEMSDLQALGVATGPGSFTSLRIGLAVAEGISLGLHIPVIGIPTLDIQAAGVPVQDIQLAAVLQAGRGRLAVGWYQAEQGKWVSQGDPQVYTPEGLEQAIKKPTLIAGELGSEERHTLARRWKKVILTDPAMSIRRPANLATLAWRRWQNMDVDNPVSMAPIYIHYKEAIPE